MPATGNFVLDKGYDAGAALTKYRAVKFTADEVVGPITAITDVVAGVEQYGVTAGEIAKGKGASVRRAPGITIMEASEAIAVGVEVCITADGRAQSLATAAATARVIGVCEHPSSGVGARCSVALHASQRQK
jgi:hypothetical protein